MAWNPAAICQLGVLYEEDRKDAELSNKDGGTRMKGNLLKSYHICSKLETPRNHMSDFKSQSISKPLFFSLEYYLPTVVFFHHVIHLDRCLRANVAYRSKQYSPERVNEGAS